MSVDAVTTFFALLAVLAIVVAIGSWTVWLVFRRPAAGAGWRTARAAIGEVALPGAFAVALTATLGSLYLSEVAHFPPCELCWYQRIAMYPLTLVLGVATLRRDAGVRWYVLPSAAVGLAISVYHYLLERFPDSVASSCDTEVPCTTVWVWKFSFLSIPAMGGIGFVLIITLVLLATPPGRRGPDPDTAPPPERATAEATQP